MEVKLDIGYEQLIAIIHQLPTDEVNKLKAEIERITSERKAEASDDLASFLASGPVMSDEKYQEFEDNRQNFSQWRAS
jgi:hypothetical protein